jgi:hypothetical protein
LQWYFDRRQEVAMISEALKNVKQPDDIDIEEGYPFKAGHSVI